MGRKAKYSAEIKLKNDASVPLSVINKLCRLLRCQPGDLIEYVDDLTPGADERFC